MLARPRDTSPLSRLRNARLLASLALALAVCAALPGGAIGAGQLVGARAKLPASASLQECQTSNQQAERSATFAGEMSTIAGSARMEMRIDLLERLPGEETFHLVAAPGLSVWRSSDPGVKVFKYIKQVTDLSAPAFYRASVRFRWLNGRSRLMKVQEVRTTQCEQPAPAPEEPAPVGG